MPGKNWVQVVSGTEAEREAGFGGMRRIRLLPTAYVEAGTNASVSAVYDGGTSDWLNEVRWAVNGGGLSLNGVTNENYNERLLATVREDAQNMLTIHAEAEGGVCLPMYEKFLDMAKARGISFAAPGDLLPADTASLPRASIVKGEIPGREGWLALKQDSPSQER